MFALQQESVRVLAIPALGRCFSLLRDKGSYRVVSVDGTFKVLVSAQRHRQHGRRGTSNAGAGLHVAVTARTRDGCCFFTELFNSEFAPMISSRRFLVPGVTEQLQRLVSDRPLDWETRATIEAFTQLACVVGDPMHLASRVSDFIGGSSSRLSLCSGCCERLERCYVPFHQPRPAAKAFEEAS